MVILVSNTCRLVFLTEIIVNWHRLLLGHRLEQDNPWKRTPAVQSRLGYLLSGPMSNSTRYTTSASMLNILIQHKNEEYDLERFWKLESMGVTTDEYTNINNDFSETYETTSIRYKDNHYSAKLPTWR
jgi:hypothetical protein